MFSDPRAEFKTDMPTPNTVLCDILVTYVNSYNAILLLI